MKAFRSSFRQVMLLLVVGVMILAQFWRVLHRQGTAGKRVRVQPHAVVRDTAK